MFNLAIDSKLRGCDVVALKVEEVAPNGYSVDRATVRQKQTGRAARFELTEQTRQAVDTYIRTAGKKPGEFLFTRPRSPDTPGTQINSIQIPFSSGPSLVYTLLFNANLVAGYYAIETQLAINNAVDPNYQINFSFSALNNVLAQTPLPATLPLFASGLGGFGLLSWRRRRKAATIAALSLTFCGMEGPPCWRSFFFGVVCLGDRSMT